MTVFPCWGRLTGSIGCVIVRGTAGLNTSWQSHCGKRRPCLQYPSRILDPQLNPGIDRAQLAASRSRGFGLHSSLRLPSGCISLMPAVQSVPCEFAPTVFQRLVAGLLLLLFLIPEGYTPDLPLLQEETAELRAGDLPSGVPEFNDPTSEDSSVTGPSPAICPSPARSFALAARAMTGAPFTRSPCQPRAPPHSV